MSDFLKYVQQHERAWGTTLYSGRPSLEHILSSKVVVFWLPLKANGAQDPQKEIISLHDSLRTLETYLIRMIFFANKHKPDKQFIRAYVDQRLIKIKGAKIEFGYADEESA